MSKISLRRKWIYLTYTKNVIFKISDITFKDHFKSKESIKYPHFNCFQKGCSLASGVNLLVSLNC